MLPNIETLSVLSRIYQSDDVAESNIPDSFSDSLVLDERAVASRASLVESKLAALRQQATNYIRRSRSKLEVN